MNKPNVLGLITGLLLLYAFTANLSAEIDEAPTLWRQALGGRIITAPQVQAKSLVVITDDKSLRAFSFSGRLLWRFQAFEKLAACLARSPEGTSYFGTITGSLIALNRSGRELWRRPINGPPESILVGWDGRLFVVSGTQLWCFSASGFQKWRLELSATITCPSSLSNDGGVVLALDDGRIVLVSPFGELQSIDCDLEAKALCVANDEIIVGTTDGSLFRLNPQAGKLGLLVFPSTVIALNTDDKTVGYYLQNGQVGLVSLSDGQQLWNDHLSAALKANCYKDERGWFFLSDSAAAAYDEAGRRFWNLRLTGSAELPSFSDDGILFSGGRDWILNAYRIEERVKSNADNFYAHFPDQTYGLANLSADQAFQSVFGVNEQLIDSQFQEIENLINNRAVGVAERTFLPWLMELAGAALNPVPARWAAPPLIAEWQRARAALLIGVLGSRDHIEFLSRLFRLDPASSVRAAAATAIGLIGVDPTALAIKVFRQAIDPPGKERDEGVLQALVAATYALCRFSGPPLSSAGLPILVSLAQDSRPAIIRAQAQTAIARLMGKS